MGRARPRRRARRLGRGARDRPRAVGRSTASSPPGCGTRCTSARSSSSSAARSPASSAPPGATRSTSRSTGRRGSGGSSRCSAALLAVPALLLGGALTAVVWVVGAARLVGGALSPGGCPRAPQPRRGRPPLQRPGQRVPLPAHGPLPVRRAGVRDRPRDEQLALDLGRRPTGAAPRNRAGLSRAVRVVASPSPRSPPGSCAPRCSSDGGAGRRSISPRSTPTPCSARRSSARRSTSSGSSSSPGSLGQIALFATLWVYARRGPRFARESAAGPIGTGMLLGMLGLGIVWLVQLPFALLDLWWARRHDLTETGYLEWAFGHWFELGGDVRRRSASRCSS